MKRFLNHITALLLASMFLVSFTGFRLLVHHCMSCDTVDVFFANYTGGQCKDIHLQHHLTKHLQGGEATGVSSCCKGDHHHTTSCALSSGCCETEEIFVRNEEVVSHERLTIKVQPLEKYVSLPSELLFIQSGDALSLEFNFYQDIQPPPKLVGREFVIFSHQLKFS
jgi:hypothetical protein